MRGDFTFLLCVLSICTVSNTFSEEEWYVHFFLLRILFFSHLIYETILLFHLKTMRNPSEIMTSTNQMYKSQTLHTNTHIIPAYEFLACRAGCERSLKKREKWNFNAKNQKKKSKTRLECITTKILHFKNLCNWLSTCGWIQGTTISTRNIQTPSMAHRMAMISFSKSFLIRCGNANIPGMLTVQ